MEKINWHKEMRHELVLLSASPYEWIEPWAKAVGFDRIICTKIEVINGKITGKIHPHENCYGKKKLAFLRNEISDLESYYVYAYGDSKSDIYVLNIADEAFYRRF
jgi:HAD superfamily phosphoserine phosphatase-like hydrolase